MSLIFIFRQLIKLYTSYSLVRLMRIWAHTQNPETRKVTLDYKFDLPVVEFGIKFHGSGQVPNSRQRKVSDDRTGCLWRLNDHRSVICSTILDALTPGPAPISNVTNFHCSDGALSAMFALHKKVDFPGFILHLGF